MINNGRICNHTKIAHITFNVCTHYLVKYRVVQKKMHKV